MANASAEIVLANGRAVVVEQTIQEILDVIEKVPPSQVPLVNVVDAETGAPVWINANQIAAFHLPTPRPSWRPAGRGASSG